MASSSHRRRSFDPQVIYWPTSISRKSSGWLLGWKFPGRGRHTSISSSDPCVDTLVVAVCVRRSKSRKDCENLLQQKRRSVCFCCSCRVNDGPKFCGGCIRRLGVASLQVVGVNQDEGSPLLDKSGYYVFRIDETCVPVLCNKPQSDVQVVVYDDRPLYHTSRPKVDDYKYQSEEYLSFMNSQLLPRLSHVECLHDMLHDDGAPSRIQPHSPTNRSSTVSATKMNDFSWHSYFLQHICDCSSPWTTLIPLVFPPDPVRSHRTRQQAPDRRHQQPDKCAHCQKSLLWESRYTLFRQRLDCLSDYGQAVLNATTGAVFGVIASLYIQSITQDLVRMLHFYNSCFSWGIDWLQDSPLGVKVNRDLTAAIGTVLRTVHKQQQASTEVLSPLLMSTRGSHAAATVILAVGVIFGASALIALVRDAILFTTLPLRAIAAILDLVFHVETKLLGTFWLLFRGKKKNILRQRVDTMPHDPAQHLLGTVLFAVCLFLLTTFALYFICFKIVALLLLLIDKILALAQQCCRPRVLGAILFRLRHPELFVTSIYLAENHRLGIVSQSIGSLLSSRA